MKQADKLSALRAEMKNAGVDGFLIPRADEYMGEYVPKCGARLEWISGFSGSAGAAAVLSDGRAVAVTDHRYELRIAKEVDQTLFERRIAKRGAGMAEWLVDNGRAGEKIGYDPRLHTAAAITQMQNTLKAKKIKLVPLAENLVDKVWADRPPMPADKVIVFPEAIAGRSAHDKRADIAKAIAAKKCKAVVITQPDSIAWLLNIRGNDVPHTPFALSQAILHDDGRVDWFIDRAKITPEVRTHLGNQVTVRAPAELEQVLTGLAKKTVMIDPARSAIWFDQVLRKAGAKLVPSEDPCLLPKACKNTVEQDGIRRAHHRDGVSLTRFLAWLDREAVKGGMTEKDVVAKLLEFRKQDPELRDTSFGTICGWQANGADMHYSVTDESNAAIVPPGILLVDSGGQYLDGTTDVTRTMAIGAPTDAQRKAFTLVLKGHIRIASAIFPVGTRGVDLDVLARDALFRDRKNFAHGTGHGVGQYLSVHEEGGGLSSAAMRAFAPGMVVSNEPGYYQKGAFGIRIESLVLVREDGAIGDEKAMSFETLTLAPIDRKLIDPALLEGAELDWLNAYHARVAAEIGPHLDAADRAWLQEVTQPLKKPEAAAPVPGPWPFPKAAQFG